MRMGSYGYFMLALALLVTAIIPIGYKLGSGINPITLMLIVSGIGTLISFILVLIRGTLPNAVSNLTHKDSLLAMSTFGIFAYTVLALIFSFATHYVSADITATVYRSWPLILVLIAPLILREKINRYQLIGVVIGFSSLLITLIGGTVISVPQSYLPYIGLLLIGAVLDAFVSAISKRYHYELTSSIFSYNLISFIAFTLLATLTNSLSFPSFSIGTLSSLLILGILQNVVLTFLFVSSIRIIKTSIASNIYLLSPFITMMLGGIFLGEKVLPSYLIIAFGVSLGLLIQYLAPKGPNYLSHDKRRLITVYDVTSAFINNKSPIINKYISGENRALAIELDIEKAKKFVKKEVKLGEGLFFIHTMPHQDIRMEEIDFLREILGIQPDHVVLVGMGDPETVERILSRF